MFIQTNVQQQLTFLNRNNDIVTRATSLINYKIILNFDNNFSADWRDLPNIGIILLQYTNLTLNF